MDIKEFDSKNKEVEEAEKQKEGKEEEEEKQKESDLVFQKAFQHFKPPVPNNLRKQKID